MDQITGTEITGNEINATDGTTDGNANGNSNATETTTQPRKPRARKTKSADGNLEKNLVEQETPVSVEISEKEVTQKKPKKKTVKVSKENVTDLSNLITGVFAVASLKAGSHWQVTEDEALTIASPLARILDRYDLLNKANEVSDPVALIVAVATITVPRVMVGKMSKPEKKKEILKNNGAVITGDEKTNPSGNSRGHSGQPENLPPSDDGQFIKSFSNQVSNGF